MTVSFYSPLLFHRWNWFWSISTIIELISLGYKFALNADEIPCLTPHGDNASPSAQLTYDAN